MKHCIYRCSRNLAARDVQAELSLGWECAARRGGTVLGANEMSGSVARNVSGFGVRHGAILKPGTLVTGNPEDEIRRDIHGLAGEASDASRGSAVTGGM